MIEIINFNNINYPKFQLVGNAAQFAIPFAKHICVGEGYDIGCMKKEWAFPDSIPIDLSFEDGFHAMNLPKNNVDYIFSSHCLEHIENWVDVLDYWYSTLKVGGVMFLYLPDYSQHYWRPWNNRKHKNIFSAQILKDYMTDKGYKNIFTSQVDLNNSFMIFGEK
jgi:predicted SAM-dependent methyltransferase